jgi:hypothetical protein
MYIIQFDCGAAPPPALLYMPMATDLLELVYIMCIHLVIALYMSSKSFIMPDNFTVTTLKSPAAHKLYNT